MTVDWGKLVTFLLAIGASCALAIAGKIDGTAAMSVVLMITGYVCGNGRLAAKGGTPQPMIGRKPRTPGGGGHGT